MTVDTSSPYLLAAVAPVLGAFGWAVWKITKRAASWTARKLIIEPVKTGLNEVVDDRIEAQLESVNRQVGHLHKCIEDRTKEIVDAHEAAQEQQAAFMVEARDGGKQIVAGGAAEFERLWAAIEAVGGKRPEASIREAQR